jgi:hypothetical protein
MDTDSSFITKEISLLKATLSYPINAVIVKDLQAGASGRGKRGLIFIF